MTTEMGEDHRVTAAQRDEAPREDRAPAPADAGEATGVEEQSEQSFPASDPPTHGGTT